MGIGTRRTARLAASSAVVAALVAGVIINGASATASAVPHQVTHSSRLVRVLRTIPDSAPSRSYVCVDNARAIWAAAGFKTPPTVEQLLRDKRAYRVLREFYASPTVGTGLLYDAHFDREPLGYSPTMLDSQVVAGDRGDQLAAAWGPISATKVLHLLDTKGKGKVKASKIASGTLLNLKKAEPPKTWVNPFRFIGWPYLAVPSSGNRIFGGSSVAGITRAADGTAVSHSLASSPTLHQALAALGTSSQSLCVEPNAILTFAQADKDIFGVHPTAAQTKTLTKASGIKKLLAAPVTVGLSHVSGGPSDQTIKAVAIYPTTAAAKSAVGSVARYTVDGLDYQYDKPFSRFWHVSSISVSGRLLTMTLRTRHPLTVTNDIGLGDFPLFWAP